MKLQWLGHACFLLEADGYALVIDPYDSEKVPGLRPLDVEADEVVCSHAHNDHGYVRAVRLRQSGKPSPFTITRVASAHDDCGGAKRGMNMIHVVEAGGVRVAHLGDVGCALTVEQREATGPLDGLLIPVGGYYTIDAAQAKAMADALHPHVVIPMHYRTAAFGLKELTNTLDDFIALCDNVRIMDGDTIEITNGMARETIVLQYLG